MGATEQHGPNMTLETDTAVAYQLALRTAAALHPRAVVSPPLPYGVSYHHMGFPGTMTLSPETFQAVVLEVVESLRATRGGALLHHRRARWQPGRARRADDEATVSDGDRAAYLFYFTIVDDLMREGAKTERWGHACEVETSMGLALQPDIVRGEALEREVTPALLPYSDVLGAHPG